MLTVFPCYSPADAALARELAAFLERGTGARIFLEDGELRPGEDLIAKVEEGRTADVVLALLSPDSVPDHWPLDAWQDAFWRGPEAEGVAVAALLCRDCRFPPLLGRKNFLKLAGERLAAFRAVKRWMLALRPVEEPAFVPAAPGAEFTADVEALAVELADKPGIATVAETAAALAFAARHAAEFEAVLWLGGPDSPAGLAGEMAAQLGMKAQGPLEENESRLRRIAAERRLLLTLDGVDGPGPVPAGGLLSVLRIAQAPRPAPPDLPAEEAALLAALAAFGPDCAAALTGEAVLATLQSRGLALRLDARLPRYRPLAVPPPDEAMETCHARVVLASGGLGAVRRAFFRALPREDWELACALGRRGATLAVNAGRLAEASEILAALSPEAEAREDFGVFDYCARERAWILEAWGRVAEAQALRQTRRALVSGQGVFDFMLA
jgi:hypothetical protein